MVYYFYLLILNPIFLLGIIIIGVSLVSLFRRNHNISKIKTTTASLILYYYLCILLINIIGMPTLNDLIRLSQSGYSIFNPNLHLIPFSDGISLSFILNIFLFVPFGFLCPLICRKYERARNTILIGFGLSLFVEISQLFTLARATDIDDLLTNVMGTILGYLIFKLIAKLGIIKQHSTLQYEEKDYTKYLLIIIIASTIILGFLS